MSAADGMDADRALVEFIERHERLLVLTGAGCSTDSGIPDYRDADGEWKRGQPLMHQAFIGDVDVRRRYWARGMVGWKRIDAARPNRAHHALAALESQGRLSTLITQNVDALHQRAGSRNVIDLHGRVDEVHCLNCDWRGSRAALQALLLARNPGFAGLQAAAAPDGDALLENVDFSQFDVPDCEQCGGILKPDVVFFGDSVPRQRVTDAMQALEQSDALLVVGSSLMVFSGYRFAVAMAEAARPVAAINIGRTRADDLLSLKVSAPCGEVLDGLLRHLKRYTEKNGVPP